MRLPSSKPKCTAPDDPGRAGGKLQQLEVSQNDSTLGWYGCRRRITLAYNSQIVHPKWKFDDESSAVEYRSLSLMTIISILVDIIDAVNLPRNVIARNLIPFPFVNSWPKFTHRYRSSSRAAAAPAFPRLRPTLNTSPGEISLIRP
jgi:hypothetical protein